MDVSHSVWYNEGLKVFSKTELKFCWETSFCQFQTWLSSRSEENVNLNHFNTKWCHSVGLSCNFVRTCLFCFDWQMLLPLFVYQKFGRCYVIGFVCGWCRTTCFIYGQMLLPCAVCDRCYVTFTLVLWLMFIVTCCLWFVVITLCYSLFIGRYYAMWLAPLYYCKRALKLAHGWCCCHFFVLLGWCYCLLL